MNPTLGWTQEEEDIKCAKLLKCNKENMLLLSFRDREITSLNNIIHDRKKKCGAFKFLRP